MPVPTMVEGSKDGVAPEGRPVTLKPTDGFGVAAGKDVDGERGAVASANCGGGCRRAKKEGLEEGGVATVREGLVDHDVVLGRVGELADDLIEVLDGERQIESLTVVVVVVADLVGGIDLQGDGAVADVGGH